VVEEVGVAKSGYKPTVGTDLSIGREINDGVSAGGEKRSLTATRADIYAKQNLYNGRGTESYVDETKARVMAAAYEVLNVANTVFNQTVEDYLQVLQNKELLKLAEDNVYTQAQILKQIEEKTAAGFGRQSDLLNTQSRLALARANVISKQQNLKQSTVALHKQVGRFLEPEQLVLPKIRYDFSDNVDKLVDIAFKNYPAIDVARFNVLVKKYAMKRTEALYYPQIDGELRAGYSNNTGGDIGDNKSYSAMLYLKYDFYDGGKRKAEKRKNMKDILKENERSYIERRNLNHSVRLAWNIRMAEKEKHFFLKEHQRLSGATLNAFKDEYQLGRRTLIELLDMENEFQKANDAVVDSKYASMTASYRLSFVTGTLLFEHETGLFDKVGLGKQRMKLALLENYAKFEEDRDTDKALDKADQCDNSLYNAMTGEFGCIDTKGVMLGYKVPKDLEPYIRPKEEDSLGGDEDSLEALSAEEELGEPESLDQIEAAAAEAELEPVPELELLLVSEPEPIVEPEPVEEPMPDGPAVPFAHTGEPTAEELAALGLTKLIVDDPATPTEEVMAISKKADVQSFNFSEIRFELNSSRLTRKGRKIVEKVGAQLKTIDDFKLEIIGHTDTKGRAAFNNRLSRKRAKTVYNKLVSMGIEPAKMKAYGMGEKAPIYSNRNRAGRQKNRRIEFRITNVK
jgi:adhesin transport system outer membrane protein